MTGRILAQAAAEALSSVVPGAAAAEMRAEVLTRATPPAELTALVQEYVATVQPPAELTRALIECLAGVQPSAEVTHLLLETLSSRDPSLRAEDITLPELLLEVLHNNTGAGGSVQRDVFAFRHNWTDPLVERLEWQTSVARASSGHELRQANRTHPRRSLTYRVGTGRTCDALVADWLSEHLGKPAWWPLPQYAVRLGRAAMAEDTTLQTPGIEEHHFTPPSAQLLFSNSGLRGWNGQDRYALLIGPDNWQTVRIHAVEEGTVVLDDPLPRAAAAGSSLMPLLWGRASEPVNFTQLIPGVAASSVTAQFDPAPESASWHADPLLDDLPVWPDGNWSSDPSATVAASVTQHDLSPAQPWVRRDDPWTLSTLQRRYLATSSEAIDAWRERLWRAQGRLNAFWVPDALAPVLRLTQPYQPEDGWLSVDAGQATDFWHRPAACLILLPDGEQRHLLTGPLDPEAGGTLMLRSTIDEAIPAGSRVIRLMRCRLDHDAVDLHWHAPQLVEIALTLRQLPEAQSVAPIDWPTVVAHPTWSAPMTLSAPPRPPQFQCPPVPRPRIRYSQVHNPFWAFRVPQGIHSIWVWGCGAGANGGRAWPLDAHPSSDFGHGGAGGSSGYYNTAPFPVQVTPGELIQVAQGRGGFLYSDPNGEFASDGQPSTFGHYLTFPGGKGGGNAKRDRPGRPQPTPLVPGLTVIPGQEGKMGSPQIGGDGGIGGVTPFRVNVPLHGAVTDVQFDPQRGPLLEGQSFGNLGGIGRGLSNSQSRTGVVPRDLRGIGRGGAPGSVRGAVFGPSFIDSLYLGDTPHHNNWDGFIVLEWDDPTPPEGQPL